MAKLVITVEDDDTGGGAHVTLEGDIPESKDSRAWTDAQFMVSVAMGAMEKTIEIATALAAQEESHGSPS